MAIEQKGTRYTPQETDLRGITRESDRCLTTVTLFRSPFEDGPEVLLWLRLGMASLTPPNSARSGRPWYLRAFLGRDATDREHDSAKALGLPVIGVEFGGADYQRSSVMGWIDPDPVSAKDEFRVPRPGYDPWKLEGAVRCTEETKKGHLIVPDGYYYPPFDAELWRAVRGRRIEIAFDVAPKGRRK